MPSVSYSSVLISVYAAPSYEKPVDTLQDVVNVLQATDMNILITKGDTVELLFKVLLVHSNSPAVSLVFQRN